MDSWSRLLTWIEERGSCFTIAGATGVLVGGGGGEAGGPAGWLGGRVWVLVMGVGTSAVEGGEDREELNSLVSCFTWG